MQLKKSVNLAEIVSGLAILATLIFVTRRKPIFCFSMAGSTNRARRLVRPSCSRRWIPHWREHSFLRIRARWQLHPDFAEWMSRALPGQQEKIVSFHGCFVRQTFAVGSSPGNCRDHSEPLVIGRVVESTAISSWHTYNNNLDLLGRLRRAEARGNDPLSRPDAPPALFKLASACNSRFVIHSSTNSNIGSIL